jgi:hypothetical protein
MELRQGCLFLPYFGGALLIVLFEERDLWFKSLKTTALMTGPLLVLVFQQGLCLGVEKT